MTAGVYRITHLPTRMTYIGESQDIESRWEAHKKFSGAYSSTDDWDLKEYIPDNLYSDLMKYPEEEFLFKIIQVMPGSTPGERREVEKRWKEEFNSYHPKGYNFTRKCKEGRKLPEK